MSQCLTLSPTTVAGRFRTADGETLSPPSDWVCLPPGDAGLTRRVKAAGPSWQVVEKRRNKTFSRGLWAPACNIAMAARGADGRLFAWGNRADTRKANVYDTFDMPDRRAPGAMPFDRSPYGVLDTTGNVSEWTSTWYDEARKEYTVCGANFNSRRGEEMLLLRRPCVASKSQDWVGFRIAMDLPAVDRQPKRADKW